MRRKADIKKIRKGLGESQVVFAQRFGVDQATIHRWEKNGPPKSGPAKIMLDEMLREAAE